MNKQIDCTLSFKEINQMGLISSLNENMLEIPVIIPHYQAMDKLSRVIECIQKQKNVETILFVRDNSLDNILWTKAINEGLRKFTVNINYEYCLLLSHDAYLPVDAISTLLQTMENDHSIGICSSAFFDPQKNYYLVGGLASLPWGTVSTFKNLPNTIIDVKWASGACMLLRTSMIREIGLFDENMRFLFSDVDYSFLARSRGYRVVVDTRVIIEHHPGASFKSPNQVITTAKYEDQNYFTKKWVTGDLFKSLCHESKEYDSERLVQQITHAFQSLSCVS